MKETKNLTTSILPATMKTFLSILFLFCIYIKAGGARIVCERCSNFYGDTCNKTVTEVCPPGVTRCRTTLMYERIGNNSYYQIWKSCARSEDLCTLTFNMTVGIDVYSLTKCCRGRNCNRKESLKLVPTNHQEKENGVECPYCYKQGARSCTPTGTIKCRGPQTRCFSFSGKICNSTHAEDWSYQGCATENICQRGIPPFPETVYHEGYSITCTKRKDEENQNTQY